MPTRDQVERATPRCVQLQQLEDDAPKVRCGRLMEWDQELAAWGCPLHNAIKTGRAIVKEMELAERV